MKFKEIIYDKRLTKFSFCFSIFCLLFVYYCSANNGANFWHLKSYPENMSYGGTVTKISENSYRFESRTNPFCIVSIVRCNKALVSYKNYTKPVDGKVIIFEFDLVIEKYNFNHSPGWWVLFQDWVRIDPDNNVGNRPISTLEVKSYGNKLYLRHKDAAFQWHNDPTRTKQVNNGQIQIHIGKSYRIRIEITESTVPQQGGMSFFVDNKLISTASYQTKSATQWRENVQEFGLYHDKGFDPERLSNNKVIFSINNLVRHEQ